MHAYRHTQIGHLALSISITLRASRDAEKNVVSSEHFVRSLQVLSLKDKRMLVLKLLRAGETVSRQGRFCARNNSQQEDHDQDVREGSAAGTQASVLHPHEQNIFSGGSIFESGE
jgi:hypothetical protein